MALRICICDTRAELPVRQPGAGFFSELPFTRVCSFLLRGGQHPLVLPYKAIHRMAFIIPLERVRQQQSRIRIHKDLAVLADGAMVLKLHLPPVPAIGQDGQEAAVLRFNHGRAVRLPRRCGKNRAALRSVQPLKRLHECLRQPTLRNGACTGEHHKHRGQQKHHHPFHTRPPDSKLFFSRTLSPGQFHRRPISSAQYRWPWSAPGWTWSSRRSCTPSHCRPRPAAAHPPAGTR